MSEAAESRREPVSEEEEEEDEEEKGEVQGLQPEKTGKKFKKGDTALAMHQGILYEARVRAHSGAAAQDSARKAADRERGAQVAKVDEVDGKPHYYVHYMGWNKKWDEWQNELLEQTPHNLEVAKELKAIVESARSNAKRGFEKRRKRQRPAAAADAPATRELASIPLTFQLKRRLVDDWEVRRAASAAAVAAAGARVSPPRLCPRWPRSASVSPSCPASPRCAPSWRSLWTRGARKARTGRCRCAGGARPPSLPP